MTPNLKRNLFLLLSAFVISCSTNDNEVAIDAAISADLSIVISASENAPNAGTTITFTLTATNNGPQDATEVSVTNIVPSGYTFVSADPSTGAYSNSTGIWAVGNLADGSEATLSIAVLVDASGDYTNTASISGKAKDDESTNNSATLTLTVATAENSTDLSITNTVDNSTPNMGANITFMLTATNNGPQDATGVSVTNILPSGYTFVSADPSMGAYNNDTGIWAVGDLTNPSSATLTIVATVNATGGYANTAIIAGQQPDATTDNNSAAATTSPEAIPTSSIDIYIAGTTFHASGKLQATFWKNGVPTYLTDGTTDAQANAMVVVGNDIYVAGYEKNIGNAKLATIWKNGIATVLSEGIGLAEANSVFVSGNDVYVGGYVYMLSSATGEYLLETATIWKNGVPTNYTTTASESTVNSVFVDGADVYGFGTRQLTFFNSLFDYALYWKNNQGTVIGVRGQSIVSSANKGVVIGADVYVAGFQSQGSTGNGYVDFGIRKVTLWKNGVATNLTDGTNYAEGTSLAVKGNDVYIGGYEKDPNTLKYRPKYWKNGVATTIISDATQHTKVKALQVYNNDVYTVGEIRLSVYANEVKLWKNTTEVSTIVGATYVSDLVIVEN